MDTKKTTMHCAIYTRKSHEEGLDMEFNSLDAQRQAAEAYITSQRHAGWVALPTEYSDGGYTGGNIERPALRKLLADIERDRIDVVVVYKVDRLSRSLMDFVRMITLFDQHQVAFVSVTQHFDTSTSMGRLILNILLSFAQFEREIIGERIRDKNLATAQQGKYIGGLPILGLDIVNKKYVVDEPEAKVVRHIFEVFEKLESCRKVATALNAEGLRTKPYVTKSGQARGNKEWTARKVHNLLTERKYIGQIVHKGKAYPAEHPAILPVDLFERVAATLRGNRTCGDKHKVRRFALLRQMLRCGHCGSTIQPTWTKNRGREVRYYTCRKKISTGYSQCPLPCLPAGQIEKAVIDQLRALLRHPDVVARTYREVSKSGGSGPDPVTLAQLADLHKRREQTQKSIRAVLNVGDQEEGFMATQLKRLNDELKALEQGIREIEAQPAPGEPMELNRVSDALRAVDPVWDVLFPEEQRRIVQLLVENITVSSTSIDIRFRNNGIEQIVEELQPTKERMYA